MDTEETPIFIMDSDMLSRTLGYFNPASICIDFEPRPSLNERVVMHADGAGVILPSREHLLSHSHRDRQPYEHMKCT